MRRRVMIRRICALVIAEPLAAGIAVVAQPAPAPAEANAFTCWLIGAGCKPSPAGCVGKTDYPHKSFPDASVHARTTCNSKVSTLSVTTVLKRERWYGLETLNSGTASLNNVSKVEKPVHWKCLNAGTYSYRGYATHKSIESGATYTASTSNWQIPGLSRFAC